MRHLALAAAFLLALAAAGSCRHKRTRVRIPIDRPEAPLPLPGATLMPGVVAPRLLPAAAHASARQQAIESIGTYEWQDFTAPGSRLVNTNGDYWTHLADLAWRRDIEIHLDNVPLDLDQDGTVDTHVTRDISLRGGILGNPESRVPIKDLADGRWHPHRESPQDLHVAAAGGCENPPTPRRPAR